MTPYAKQRTGQINLGKWVANTGQLSKRLREMEARAKGDRSLRAPTDAEWAWTYFIEQFGLWEFQMSDAFAKALWPGIGEWMKGGE